MARLGWVVLHDAWGSLRWSKTEGRCVGAPTGLRVADRASGVRGATLWRSLPEVRHAIAATADYFVARGWDASTFIDECRILPVEE